jgi:hypothetical protein
MDSAFDGGAFDGGTLMSSAFDGHGPVMDTDL